MLGVPGPGRRRVIVDEVVLPEEFPQREPARIFALEHAFLARVEIERVLPGGGLRVGEHGVLDHLAGALGLVLETIGCEEIPPIRRVVGQATDQSIAIGDRALSGIGASPPSSPTLISGVRAGLGVRQFLVLSL